MGLQYELYKELQNNSQRFNERFIRQRELDNPQFYLDAICKILEIIDGIEYLGSEIIEDEHTIWTKYINPKTLGIGDSRLNLALLNFRVSHEDLREGLQQETIQLRILFPKLIDNFFFRLNGSNYGAIYQMVDKAFYITKRSCVLKTLSMPIVCTFAETFKFQVHAYNKMNQPVVGGLTTPYVFIKIFKRELNPFMFFVCKYGFEETMKISGCDKYITICDEHDDTIPYEHNQYIEMKIVGKTSIFIDKHELQKNPSANKKVFTMAHLIVTSKRSKVKMQLIETWRKLLGAEFTANTNGYIDKSISALKSFERVMDDTTRASLSFIPEKSSENIFNTILWLLENIDNLKRNDNYSIYNKRLRFWEYIVFPLQLKFYKANNRNLNNGRNNNFASKKRIFNIPYDIITSSLLTTNLHRYDNCTSAADLVSAGLKYSARGPQSVAESTDDISINHRDIHPSTMGYIDPYVLSNSDPGLQGALTPFIELAPGMVFNKELAILAEDVELELEE
jgi:hypothetical protein